MFRAPTEILFISLPYNNIYAVHQVSGPSVYQSKENPVPLKTPLSLVTQVRSGPRVTQVWASKLTSWRGVRASQWNQPICLFTHSTGPTRMATGRKGAPDVLNWRWKQRKDNSPHKPKIQILRMFNLFLTWEVLNCVWAYWVGGPHDNTGVKQTWLWTLILPCFRSLYLP